MNTSEKLAALRAQLKKHGLDGYLQPVHDEYMNEYPPASAQRVRWLSGFSGSAGAVAVTADKAALFTDGRYTLQAGKEIDAGLFELHNTAETTTEAWLKQQLARKKSPHPNPLPKGEGSARVGYDPKLYCKAVVEGLEKAGLTPIPVPNLIDAIWKDRPAPPATKIFIHPVKYSGLASAKKRAQMAAQIKEKSADALLLTAPDSVCWLLNIRASDVEHTPLMLANALLFADGSVTLFVDPKRADGAVRKHLGKSVTIQKPAELEGALRGLGYAKKTVWCERRHASMWHLEALAGARMIDAPDPCQRAKAVKNPVELSGIRAAHIRDGAAVAKLLCWLDAETKARRVRETEACEKLHALRAMHPLFHDLSFPTISGSGPNGAIVHYRVTGASDRPLKKGELFLLDSGAQYPDGTTDITRTVAIGKPSAEQRDAFTRVLKGHIAIATARFPKGTAGSQLDALARQYLWQAGLDYDHGTGHGVGCFLGVHEGPQRISKRGGDAPLAPGMIVSNEPGYYKTGKYGIRIENLVVVTQLPPPKGGRAGEGVTPRSLFAPSLTLPPSGGGDWLGFDTLTCAPIDRSLIRAAILSAEEKRWLNAYHRWVYTHLAPQMTAREKAWLKKACRAV